MHHSRRRSWFVFWWALTLTPALYAQTPEWIWLDHKGASPADEEVCYFHKEFTLAERPRRATLIVACDNEAAVFLNGQPLAENKEWNQPTLLSVTRELKPGENVLAVRAQNHGGAAGLLLRLEWTPADGESQTLVSDTSWLTSPKEAAGWTAAHFAATDWTKAASLGQHGVQPWGKVLANVTGAKARIVPGQATPARALMVPDGFKIELLRSAQPGEGSWVAMTIDPKGRLIISPQGSGRAREPMLRMSLSSDGQIANVEPLDLEARAAMGLLYAHDSLYINGKGPDGLALYRARSTDGGETFGPLETIRKWTGDGGEHGPHGVVLGPDKKLYVVCGNFVNVPQDILPTSPHRHYADDVLLPRMEDGNGFGAGKKPPGGFVARLDADGTHCELFASGQRNTYDIAFSPEGELFGFDSDMEWDWGTPWYRPIRVCHFTSAADHGFREGTAKWPPYYPDSLPAVVDVGIGSPTGVEFGTGAKFPAKYQRALYVMDWSYGRIVATHLTPSGSGYSGTWENFVAPLSLTHPGPKATLNVTDLVIGQDGALYFTTGGRGTQAGLYRVTYAGSESTAPVSAPTPNLARDLRHQLEAFHGKSDPAAIDVAWKYLDSADRYTRYAARIALESQPVDQWQRRALDEKGKRASLTVLLALARLGPKEAQEGLLTSLDRYWPGQVNEEEKLEVLRICSLSFSRMGRPSDEVARNLVKSLDPLYPSSSWPMNRELSTLLIYLEAPGVAAKTLGLLAKAPTQEEQIHYMVQLRRLQNGWTLEDRKAYFSWFKRDRSLDRHSDETLQWFRDAGREYSDGASFPKFMANLRKEAMATLSDPERVGLAGLIGETNAVSPTAAAPRRFVKDWKMADLLPALDEVSRGRNFQRGKESYAATQCLACHRFGNEGGAVGPDLTAISSRFSRKDVLESILDPSKVVSEQYQNITVTRKDGDEVTGRLIEETDTKLVLVPNQLTGEKVEVKKTDVQKRESSKLSPMPEGLLSSLTGDEILDLLAYMESGGKREHAAFAK